MTAVLSPWACDSDPATPAAQSFKDDTGENSNDGSQPSKRSRMSSENSSQSYETSNQDLSFSYFPAENLIEYKWPPAETGVYYMLQEQVSEYLGVTSFKRKYPDLESRDLSHKEKLYLGELNVSEGECALENQEEPLLARPKARERDSTPRKEGSKRSVSKLVPGYKPKDFPNAICGICLKGKESNKKGKAEALIHCSQCENSGHPSCLDMSAELVAIIKTYPWQCVEYKTCIICGHPHHEEEIIFCDASTKAIAAVAYARQRGISTCSSGFVMSKTKVAPMDFSVPRRELCATALATQLRQTVREEIT
nr:PHD finger protein 10-like [Anolis sagrei ordinatus]